MTTPYIQDYLADAASLAEPWLRWEWRLAGKDGIWKKCDGHPTFASSLEYRRRVRQLHVVLPEPLRTLPADGTQVFSAWSGGFSTEQVCAANPYIQRLFREGMLFATRADAKQAHEALVAAFTA